MKHLEILIGYVERFLRTTLGFYTWRDVVEVYLLSLILYLFISWLNKDANKYPLLFFCGYCLFTFSTYYLQLSVVSTFLLLCAPIAFIVLLFMHQYTLQKNFISHKTIKLLQNHHTQWIDELMSFCLGALNKQKEFACIIAKDDDLKPFISTSYFLYADLTKNFLNLLAESINSREKDMLWIDSNGKIVALNAQLNSAFDPIWFDEAVRGLAPWKQDSVFLTSKTDAFVIRSSVQSRLFTCIAQGKIIENLTAFQAISLLKRYLFKQSNYHRDLHVDTYHQQDFIQQKPA